MGKRKNRYTFNIDFSRTPSRERNYISDRTNKAQPYLKNDKTGSLKKCILYFTSLNKFAKG